MPVRPTFSDRGCRARAAGAAAALGALGACFFCGLALFVACQSPDGSDLFKPLDSVTRVSGTGGGGGGGGLGGQGGTVGVGGGGLIEQQGGSVAFAGAGGTTGSNVAGAGMTETLDAGPDADAAPDAAPACVATAEVCDGVDNDCDGAIDPGNTCSEDCAGFALQGRGYMFCSDSVDREDAIERCGDEGLRLVWIETPGENALLVDAIVELDVPAADSEEILTQIGGSDGEDEGEWRWVGSDVIADGFQFWEGAAADDGGEAVGGAYTNWAPTEPNDTDGEEDCAVLSVLGNNNREPGNWDDRDCDEELPFLCEVGL